VRPQPPPSPLRLRRTGLGITLDEASQAVGSSIYTLSLLERGLITRPALQTKLEQLYQMQERLTRVRQQQRGTRRRRRAVA
jgi:transcriptional regulator with XRE-family HTH domain